MFGSGPLQVDVYRQVHNRNTMGDGNQETGTDGGQRAAILEGRTRVWTIEEAVIGPTSSDYLRTSAEFAPMVNAKYIMYTPVEEDLRENDYVAYNEPTGQLKVLKVTGVGDLNYFSPYTDISVKETYLDVVKTRFGG